ncbi:hypothetical protein K438DRAFT_1826015 [Mycena galopus ATCC 62051]|nr:hypothetical protein K438DRAFT_1826015 [Mycena galopus ATCC 62051]
MVFVFLRCILVLMPSIIVLLPVGTYPVHRVPPLVHVLPALAATHRDRTPAALGHLFALGTWILGVLPGFGGSWAFIPPKGTI